jgi:hypothetical protein
MSRTLFAVLGGALLISAPIAAAQPDPADKPDADVPAARVADVPVAAAAADRTIRAESLDGLIVNTIYLDGDGALRIIREEDGGTTTGHWFARNDMVCLEWQPRGRECWPFERVASRDRPTIIESDRGQRVRVTLLS